MPGNCFVFIWKKVWFLKMIKISRKKEWGRKEFSIIHRFVSLQMIRIITNRQVRWFQRYQNNSLLSSSQKGGNLPFYGITVCNIWVIRGNAKQMAEWLKISLFTESDLFLEKMLNVRWSGHTVKYCPSFTANTSVQNFLRFWTLASHLLCRCWP